MATKRRQKIIILGAGFGGLRVALLLGHALRRQCRNQEFEIILIDRNEHHTYTPLLYEVATTSKSIADVSKLHDIVTQPIRQVLSGTPVTFLQDTVTGLDVLTKKIYLQHTPALTASYMVVALGSETNYFNIPGLQRYALNLKGFADAVRIRDTVWNTVSAGNLAPHIVIGGGGATGVELAGEMKSWEKQLGRELGACRLDITLIHPHETVLTGLHPTIVRLAERRLKKLGIHVEHNKRIMTVSPRDISLSTGETVPYDILLWAGGVKSSPLIYGRMKTTPSGSIVVGGEMQCSIQTPELEFLKGVYALGDNVCFLDPKTGTPIPLVARAALVQAGVVAKNILHDIRAAILHKKHGIHRAYVPRNYPYIVPIGGKYALAKFGPFIISGLFGWLLKGLVELNYLLSIMPFWQAVRVWLTGLKIFIQNDRLG